MNKKYRAGIIGLGNIGFRYSLDKKRKWISSHTEAYERHPDFLPVAGCDIDLNRLKSAKRYCPGINTYTSWKEMLRSEKLDILSVCVSAQMNLKVSSFNEMQDLKFIIFEKPFSMTTKDGIKIINNLKSRHILATVNYFRRWQDTINKVKTIIFSGEIGEIIRINGRYASALFNGGVHLIDTIRYLAGDFDCIQALTRIKISGSKDYAYSVYGLIKGAEIFISGFDKANYNIFEIEIWGKKGKIALYDFANKINIWKSRSSRRFSGQNELELSMQVSSKGMGTNFANLLDNINNAIKKNSVQPLNCKLEDALKTTDIADSIIESYNKNGKMILLK